MRLTIVVMSPFLPSLIGLLALAHAFPAAAFPRDPVLQERKIKAHKMMTMKPSPKPSRKPTPKPTRKPTLLVPVAAIPTLAPAEAPFPPARSLAVPSLLPTTMLPTTMGVPTTTSPTTGGAIPLDPNLVLVCRQRPENPGIGLDEADIDFVRGEPVYSVLTMDEADTHVRETIDDYNAVVDVASDIFEEVPIVSQILAVGGGALSLTSHFMSKNEADPTEELITFTAAETQQAISKLTDLVSSGFDDIRNDIIDTSLDVLWSPLQAMSFAYDNMVSAFNSTANTGLKRVYADNYRYVSANVLSQADMHLIPIIIL